MRASTHAYHLNSKYISSDRANNLTVNIDQNRLFVAHFQNSNFAHFWLINNPY